MSLNPHTSLVPSAGGPASLAALGGYPQTSPGVPLTMPVNQSGAALMPGQIGSTNLITPSVGLTQRGVSDQFTPNVLMTPVVAPGLSAAAPARMSPVVGVSPVKPISPVQPCTPGTPGLVAPVTPAAIGMVASPQIPMAATTPLIQPTIPGNNPSMVMPLSPTYAMVTPPRPTPAIVYPGQPMVTPLQPNCSMATLLQPTTPTAAPLYPGQPMVTPLQPTAPMATPFYSVPHMVTPLQPTLGTSPMMAIPNSGMVYQSPAVQMTPTIQMTPAQMTMPLSQGQPVLQAGFIPGNQMTYSQLPRSTQFASNPRILPPQVATTPLQVMPLQSAPTTTPVISNSTLALPSAGNTVALPQFSAPAPT